METGVVMFIGKTHENMLRVLANESTFSLTMLMPRSSDAFSYKSTAASGYSEYTTLYFIILYLFIIFILYYSITYVFRVRQLFFSHISRLSMEHHKRIGITTQPHSEASFCLELGQRCEELRS